MVGGMAKGYRIKDLVEICVDTGDKIVGPKKIVVNIIPVKTRCSYATNS